jgi:hypothetical protein
MPAKTKAKRGRPTKKNPLELKRILKVAESGLPLHFCAQAGNITTETLLQWRKEDPSFDQLLQAARLKAVEQRWKRIEKAAKGTQEHPPDWKADAWSLERTYPQLFGRPDLQVSLNQSVSTGPQNVVVIGPERAAVLAQRHESIRARSRQLLDGVRRGNGKLPDDLDRPEAVREAITTAKSFVAQQSPPLPDTPPAPAIRKPATWWARFIFPGAPIPNADAILALQLILGELRISVEGQALSFQSDSVSQGTFVSTLERLTGSDLGWRTLTQFYERELQRADHRS